VFFSVCRIKMTVADECLARRRAFTPDDSLAAMRAWRNTTRSHANTTGYYEDECSSLKKWIE